MRCRAGSRVWFTLQGVLAARRDDIETFGGAAVSTVQEITGRVCPCREPERFPPLASAPALFSYTQTLNQSITALFVAVHFATQPLSH
jgi:hypothetical protein